ncbi:MAG: tetratricopeptide repeat protein [Candidatus Electryoneaceae bacterium]|nr:tetratricopeptide repeat protein [Candidatus Electryoneaceae bacterium]
MSRLTNRPTVLICMFCLAIVLFGCSSNRQSIREDVLQSDSLNRAVAFEHYLAGSMAQESEDMSDAALEYQIALLFDAGSAAIAMALAQVYMQTDEPKAASIVLENSRNVNPTDVELLEMAAQINTYIGRHVDENYLDDAYNSYRFLEEVRPLLRGEYFRLAGLAYQLRRLEEAVELYNEYLDRFGQNPDVHDLIGRIYLVLNKPREAQDSFRRVVELDSTRDETFFLLGGFAVAGDDWESAEIEFRRALAIDSSNVRYWSNLMLALSGLDKQQETLSVTTAAIELFPEVPQFYDIRGSTLQRMDRLDEALEMMDTAISLDSSRISPFLTKGWIHHQQGDWEQGASAYERALTIEPDHSLILNNYAYMLSEQNVRLNDALDMVQRALAAEPDNASYLDTRGWIYYHLERHQEALRDVKQAARIESDNAELQAHLGYIYQALGKSSKAKSSWRRATQLDPDNEEYRRLAR